MIRLLVFAFLLSSFSSPGRTAEYTDTCHRITQLEDAGQLSDFQVLRPNTPSSDRRNVQHLDLDGDGTVEVIEWSSKHSQILVDGKNISNIAPEYRSVFARHGGVIDIDNSYFGVIRNEGILTLIWRFARSDQTGTIKGAPVCFFDREWKETDKCSAYSEDYYARMEPGQPKKFSIANQSEFKKPGFLDEVFDFYYGVKPYGAPIEIDFDNDRAVEQVGTVLMQLPAPRYSRFVEAPVVLARGDSLELEATFQNQRVIQYFAREGSGGNARISFLLPKQDYRDVLVDEKFMPVPLGGSAPQKPLRKIYRIRGNWPETLCQSDYTWKTVFTTDDLR